MLTNHSRNARGQLYGNAQIWPECTGRVGPLMARRKFEFGQQRQERSPAMSEFGAARLPGDLMLIVALQQLT